MDEKEAFEILASADRQILLDELFECEGEATEEELSKRVASRRHRIPLESVSDEKIRRANIRLVHTHLPLLAEKDIVQWNNENVTLAEEDNIDQLLKAAQELRDQPANDLLNHLH